MGKQKDAKRYATCWLVAHPALPTVPVTAESWELATVAAAALWGVPWAKVAAECSCEKKIKTIRGVCVKCKQIMYNRKGKDLCEACEKILAQDSKNVARRLKETWYLAPKKA